MQSQLFSRFGAVSSIAISFGLAACGSSNSSSGTKNLSTRFAVSGVTSTSSLDSRDSGYVSYAAGDVGHSGVSTALTSLQFYITRIQLCNSLTVNGSGYDNATGCIYVFGDSSSDNAYSTYKVATAAADTTSTNWVDLMSPTSISAFTSASSTAASAGTYNYVIIETRKPVKLNANFSTGNASGLRTCSTAGTITTTGTDLNAREISTVSNMQTCTQGLATFGSQGGGKWLRFQNPVTISSGKTYVLDLAFNAENAITGGKVTGGLNSYYVTYTDGTYGFYYPSIDISPVLRESTQKTIREEYTVAMPDLSGTLVVDLYYAGEKTDVGTGTIVGAQTRFVNSSTATAVAITPAVYSITSGSGSVSLNNYQSTAIVSNLIRSTTQTAGGTQSVTVNKGLFESSSSTTSATYTATFKGVLQM